MKSGKIPGKRDLSNKKSWLTKAIPLLTAAAGLSCLLPFTARQYRERRRIESELAARRETEVSLLLEGAKRQVVVLNGKRYRRNPSVHAILCLGVDTGGEMESYQASGYAGQADAIFLAAQDVARDTVRFLLIPRDTMTEITLFDLMGNELGKDVQHLNLAFAYGDGRETSCELMQSAVSDLLFDLDIDHYLAVNTGSIALFNDEIGGVEVTVKEDGLERADPALAKGNTVVLKGEQAETFLRYRDIRQSQTALSRMGRQRQYIENYINTAKREAKKDDSLITRLVDDAQQHMVTDMAKDQYMDMALALLNSRQRMEADDFITVPGQEVETELFDEYYPDREALKKIVIDLFYREVRPD